MSEAAEATDTGSDTTEATASSPRDDGPRQAMPSAAALDALARDDDGEEAEVLDGDGKPKPRAPKEKPFKFKVKRGGTEREMTAEEAAAELSDDYEHTFKIREGVEKKMRRRDIERAIQLSEGAMDKMREAAERRKEFEARDAFLKKDPWSYLERFGGVQSHEEMVMQRAHELLQEQAELEQLSKQNPFAFQQRMREKVARDMERRQQFERAHAQQAEQQRMQQQAAKEYEAKLGESFKGAGVPLNDYTKLLAAKVWKEYHDVGHELSPQDIADMTRDAYEREVLGYFDGRDDESLFKLLGDKRRERFRKLELAAVKRGGGAKPANDNGGGAQPQRSAAAANGKKPMTEGEFMKQLR